MKKILFIVSAFSFLVIASTAYAQGFVPLAPIPGLTDTGSAVVNSATLANFFNNLYKYLIGLAAALAVIQITWSGLDIAIFHKDAVSAITDDRGKIYNAIFGLILVLSPVLVFSIINPSILNLSLNLPPLNTASGNPVATVGPTGVYTDVKTIPTGQFCYAQKGQTSDPTQPPQFACFTTGADCHDAQQKDDSAINKNGCSQY
jgi:hypothetical protein